MKKLGFLFLLGLASALPVQARASDATIVSRDVAVGVEPRARERSLAVQPRRRALAGARDACSSARARSGAAGANGWTPLRRPRISPTRGPAERARAKRLAAREPLVGRDRPTGSSTGARAPSPVCARTSSGASPRTCRRGRSSAPARRRSCPRAGWKADESIVRSKPAVASALRVAIVHHTAGANGYDAAQSAAIVRGDPGLPRARETAGTTSATTSSSTGSARSSRAAAAGSSENVVGAHAEGFNTGSVGVAVLGEYGSLAVAGAARDSLARLLAWRLDEAHVDPLSTLSFISNGNQRFPSGLPVFLRAVSGHRDTGFTDCPGTALYNLLNGLAGNVRAIGLPKLYAPLVTGSRARQGALPRPALVRAAVVRGRARRERDLGGRYRAGRARASTGPGTRRWRRVGPTRYSIATAGATPVRRLARGHGRRPGRRAARSPDSPPTRRRSRRTTTVRPTRRAITYTLNDGANVSVTVLDASGATVQALPRA